MPSELCTHANAQAKILKSIFGMRIPWSCESQLATSLEWFLKPYKLNRISNGLSEIKIFKLKIPKFREFSLSINLNDVGV